MKKNSVLNSVSILTLAIILIVGQVLSCTNVTQATTVVLKGNNFEVSFLNSKKILWQYQETKTGKTLDFTGPNFEIDGKKMDWSN
jgi:hypothetical protein